MKTTGEKKELGSAEDGFDSRGSQALKADDWDFTSATPQCAVALACCSRASSLYFGLPWLWQIV